MANQDTDYITLDGYKYRYVSYAYNDVEYYAEPTRQGQPRYQDFVPETVLAWRTWHHGYGDFYFLDPSAYYQAIGCDASVEQQLTLAPEVGATYRTNGAVVGEALTQFVEFHDLLYGVGSQNVFRWRSSSSPNGWVLVGGFGPLSCGQATVFTVNALASQAALPAGQYLIVPTGSAMQFYNGSSWYSVATAAAHVQAIRNEMWKVYYDANGAWQAAKTVDGVTYPNPNAISTLAANGVATQTGLLNYDNRLWLLGTNGLQTVDTYGTLYDVVPEVGAYGDPKIVGKQAAPFHGLAYIPADQGLLRFSGSVVTNPQTSLALRSIGPDQQSWSQSEAQGHFLGLGPHVNYLYGTLANYLTGDSYLMKYRDYADLPATGGYGWHPLAKFPGRVAGACKVSALPWYGGSYPIVWASVGDTVYQANLPQQNDNPLLDPNARYQLSGTFDLPIVDDQIAAFAKAWIKVTLDVVNGAATTVVVQASLDGGPYISLGGATGATGIFDYFFATAGATTSYKIQLRLLLSTTDATQTPVVRSIALYHEIIPPLLGQWQLGLLPQDKAIPNDLATSSDKIRQLKASRGSEALTNFIDVDGTNNSVTIKQLNLTLSAREQGKGAQFVANVLLQDYGLINFYFDQQDALFDRATYGADADPVPVSFYDYSTTDSGARFN